MIVMMTTTINGDGGDDDDEDGGGDDDDDDCEVDALCISPGAMWEALNGMFQQSLRPALHSKKVTCTKGGACNFFAIPAVDDEGPRAAKPSDQEMTIISSPMFLT